MTVYTQLTGLIAPIGENPMIGPETGTKLDNGIALFFQSVSTFDRNAANHRAGSYRFVRFIAGEPVAGIQVMSTDGQSGIVANAYCAPEHRRKGLTSDLATHAESYFENLVFSEDRSADGKAWVDRFQKDKRRDTELGQGLTARALDKS